MLQQLGSYIARALGEKEERISHIQDAYRQMADFYTLSDFLPFDSFDPVHNIFHNDTGMGFVVETLPLVGCSEAMQKEINNLFTLALPEGGSMQTLLWADPHIGDFVDQYADARDQATPALKALAHKRAEYLKTFAHHSPQYPYSLRNFRVIIAFSTRSRNTESQSRETVLHIQQQVIATLNMLNLPTVVWHADDLLAFLHGFLFTSSRFSSASPSSSRLHESTLKKGTPKGFHPSMGKEPTKCWNEMDRLADQVRCLEARIQVQPNGLSLRDDMEARTYTVTHFPSEWSLHAMGELIGDMERDQAQIPCPFLLHYGVYVPDQQNPRQKIRAKARYVDKQAHSPVGKYLPDIQRESAELSFVNEQLSKGEKVVQTHFSVTLIGQRDLMDASEQILRNLFISREWKLEKNRFLHLPVFLSHLPMMWGAACTQDLLRLHKIKTTLSTEASNLLPLQGEWKGTSTPGMILAGRRGQLMSWYPFDNLSGNYNVCVVGRSGSGKSVFMQELMTSTLGLGGRVFVLDVGRSFEKTCALLGGQFIEFSAQAPINLNPFAAIPNGSDSETRIHEVGNDEVAEDMLAMLKSVLFLMASPSETLSDKGAALIEQAMCEVWKNHHQDATIDHIAEWLQQHKDKTAQDMGQMLFSYTRDGTYGRFFNGRQAINFKSHLVVIEMEELKERKDLQAVVVQMIIIHISHQMFCGDRSTPFHIVLDEAWDLLRGKQSGVFIETLARRLRKYRGSLVVGTQSINDFFVNAGAQAAFDNSDWMCLLSQKPESIEQLKKTDRLSLSPQKEALLKSVKTKQGQYAEVMLSGTDGYAIGRLLLDPFSELLYSTRAEDYTAIKNIMASGLSTEEALDAYLKKRREK